MTTDPILRFVYGTRTLNLNDGSRYALEPGFTPPAALLSAQMSDGTSANRTGGATKIGQRALNRQWSFSVQCLGSSERDMTRVFQDLAVFMSYAGIDRSVPLYLEYKPNSDINVKPLWGQDGWLRYEVRNANPPQIGERYGFGEYRSRNVTALISIEVAPYAEGLQQRLCTATGGIIEDRIGTVDGLSRGMIVPEATTNNFTNPVFGHLTTWNNGWTAGASLLEAQNTDPAFLLPETVNSAKLTSRASSSNTYTQALTLSASTYMIWSVIKLPTGGAPASTMMQMYYNGSSLATSFTSAGDGFYYATASALGLAASAVTGVVVKSGHTLYLVASQAEQKTYRTPLCWGDLLGCAWGGTVHESNSSRTAAAAKISTDADVFNPGQGTVRLVWKAPFASTVPTGTIHLFTITGAGNTPWFRYNGSGDTFQVNDGTNVITTAAQTFAEGDILVFHLTYGPDGVVLYKNGASIGTSTYSSQAITAANYLYIGTSASVTLHANGTLIVETFGLAISATQVVNDYANLAQVIADDKRGGTVPWLWTKDGDDTVDNCTDITGSTGAPHDNYCVLHGIPGSVAARTVLLGRIETLNMSTVKGIVLSLLDTDRPFAVRDLIYSDSDNTDADVTCSSGGHELIGSITTTEVSKMFKSIENINALKLLDNRSLIGFMRAINASSDLKLALSLQLGTELLKSPFESVALSSATEYRWLKTGEFRFQLDSTLSAYRYAVALIGLRAYRVTGSAQLTNDFFQILSRPLIIIGNGTQTDVMSNFILSGHVARTIDTDNEIRDPLPTTGDTIELVPNRYNYLISLIGYGNVEPAIARTLTYTRVLITPRWGLI